MAGVYADTKINLNLPVVLAMQMYRLGSPLD